MIINTGLYKFKLQQSPDGISDIIKLMYGDAPMQDVWDYKVSLKSSSFLRKLFFRDVFFTSDVHSPFKPLPFSQAYPLLEWGMNWVIAAHDYNHLIVHSSVLVKDGKAILFPASPGSGKSTLTSYMGLSGWKMYSDEMAIIDTDTLMVKPLYRPACIKNESIALMKGWFPEARITQPCHDTSKGTVAHVKVHDWQEYQDFAPVRIAGVVFPQFNKAVDLELYTLSQLQVFQAFTSHAFNYHVLGKTGFDTVGKIVKSVKGFEVKYSDLAFMHDFLTEEILHQ